MLTVIQSLLKLQALDSRIRSIRKKIQRKQEEVDRHLAEQANDRETLAVMKADKNRETIELANQELELKNIDEKLAALKHKLYSGDVTSSKELSQWEKNMEIYEKTKERLEETIITQMMQLEEFQTSYRQQGDTIKRRTVQLEQLLGQAKEELASLEVELSALDQERKVLAHKMPEPVLEEYNGLLQRMNDPVAELVNDTCRGCRLSIPISIEKIIRREDELNRCPNCHRFIYPKD